MHIQNDKVQAEIEDIRPIDYVTLVTDSSIRKNAMSKKFGVNNSLGPSQQTNLEQKGKDQATVLSHSLN